MKTMKINRLWMGLMAMATLLVCSCEEKNGEVTPVFPTEVATYAVEPGDEVVVTFDANTDWQLSSNAMWCKTGGFLDAYGKAGEQQVTFTISADGQTLDADQANISLRMGDESKVIAIVTRAGFSNAVVLGNDSVDYVHNQTLVIGTEGVAALAIREISFNLNNLFISVPEWIDVQRVDSVITLEVKSGYIKYSQNNTTDSICFSDKEKQMLRLHVQYTGIDARSISVEPSSQWRIKVASDGMTYTDNLYTITWKVYDAPVKSTVTALNDLYEVVCVEYKKNAGYAIVDTPSWYTVDDDRRGNVSVSFEANDSVDRMVYIWALPEFIADSVRNNGASCLDYFICDGQVRMEAEKNLIADITQEGPLSNSLKVIHGPTYEYVEVLPETDRKWLDMAGEYMVSERNVFRASLEFAVPYILNPVLDMDAWNPSTTENAAELQIYGESGKEYVFKEDFLGEPTMLDTEGDHYLIQGFQFYIEEPFIIYFVDANKIPLKALVVTPIL